ncbi:MAG: hypothetical protein R3208_17220 [Ketobacteraceae bacterium]|nr:hypothetical protein [Ketobacteraceae bacterium]
MLSRLFVFLAGLTCSLCFAEPGETKTSKPLELDLAAGIGFHTGELQWSIASDISGNATPNILSELTFADVEYESFEARGTMSFNRGYLDGFLAQVSYLAGRASSGRNQDSDYSGDNRTGEYSRSYSDAEGSDIIAFDVVLGYRMQLNDDWTLTPKLAYSYHEQHLAMTDGVQVLDTRAHALSLGPFAGNLNSSYTAEWAGIWFGGELAWHRGAHRLSVELQGHWKDYYAEANWNLREDFAHPVSFAHWSEGTGYRWILNYQYYFQSRFSAWIQATAEDFEADPGRDVVYFADGSKGATRLNGVTWESSGYAVGVAFNF